MVASTAARRRSRITWSASVASACCRKIARASSLVGLVHGRDQGLMGLRHWREPVKRLIRCTDARSVPGTDICVPAPGLEPGNSAADIPEPGPVVRSRWRLRRRVAVTSEVKGWSAQLAPRLGRSTLRLRPGQLYGGAVLDGAYPARRVVVGGGGGSPPALPAPHLLVMARCWSVENRWPRAPRFRTVLGWRLGAKPAGGRHGLSVATSQAYCWWSPRRPRACRGLVTCPRRRPARRRAGCGRT